MGFLQEFKKFAVKGNVVDLAVGVIIGTAFGGIVTSLVNDIIMPPIGSLSGNLNFSNFFVNLSGTPVQSLAEAKQLGLATINYGVFINTVMNFLIVSFAVFLLVKQMNRFRAEDKPAPAAPPEEVQLLREIRDLLKSKSSS